MSYGTLMTLHSFVSGDGIWPVAALVQATNGIFYGTTPCTRFDVERGCLPPTNSGTVFSLSVGLGPFVETQPTSGNLGAVVKLLSTNLTGASGTFNGPVLP
jgi:hypothetical protein